MHFDFNEEQQAIRQVLFEFRSQVLDLEIERLGLTSEAVQAEFSQSLEAFAKEFPESAFGRLEAVKKMEKLVEDTCLKNNQRIAILFALGEASAKTGNYNEAFNFFHCANEARRLIMKKKDMLILKEMYYTLILELLKG